MDFAEVAPRGSDKLRKLFGEMIARGKRTSGRVASTERAAGVENGTSIVVMREEQSIPLVYSRRMTYEKLQQVPPPPLFVVIRPSA
eukprot:571344-Hanusia_phi.AAC.1